MAVGSSNRSGRLCKLYGTTFNKSGRHCKPSDEINFNLCDVSRLFRSVCYMCYRWTNAIVDLSSVKGLFVRFGWCMTALRMLCEGCVSAL